MQTTKGAARPSAERKRPDRKPTKQAKPKKAEPQTAQQTIPYRELFKDGICRVNDKLYTKSLEYEDINYQLAQADDQSDIFDGYCTFLNSFDSSFSFQLSFINHRSRPESKYKINIPMKDDEYSEMRSEYVEDGLKWLYPPCRPCPCPGTGFLTAAVRQQSQSGGRPCQHLRRVPGGDRRTPAGL